MLKLLNSSTFLRIYLTIFGAFSVIAAFLSAFLGFNYFKLLFLLLLLCVPVSFIVMIIVHQYSNSVTNGLYGLGRKEKSTTAISDSEILKLMALKEQEEYGTILSGLKNIENKYGTSSRIIYERAHCLMALGDLRKARRSIKDFLNATEPDEDDSYQQYCRRLINHDDAPLTLKNILAKAK